ncbi:MAG: hypothetical protein ABMA64_08885 [Myxococcota bacterium]
MFLGLRAWMWAGCDGEPTTRPGTVDDSAEPPDTSAPIDPDCADLDLGDPEAAAVEGSTVDAGDDWAPSCGGEGAPDVVYTFVAPADGDYVFDTVGSTFDAVVGVFSGCEGDELACDDDTADYLQAHARVTLAQGDAVLVVVDGYNGASGAFALNVNHPVPTETVCDDGGDDDFDLQIDCLDADCASVPRCAPQCPDQTVNVAPATVVGSTLGQPDEHPSYCAVGQNSDWSVAFEAPRTGRYLFEAVGLDFEAQLSLRVGGCDGWEWCYPDNATLSWDLAAGEQIVAEVTGPHRAAGAFELSITEVLLVEAQCDDAVDDDVDGLVDCFDPDCGLDPACAEVCDDDVDNDGDQWVDCADAWCATETTCVQTCPEGVLAGPLPIVVSGDTLGRTADWLAGCTFATASDETWSFVAPADGTYTVVVEAGFDVVLTVWDGCGGAELACVDDTGQLPETVELTLVADQEVLIVVDGYEAQSGPYTLRVEP